MSYPKGLGNPTRISYALSLCAFLLLGVSGPAIAAFDPNLMCSLLVNGTKIKDPRACNVWIECIDSKPVSGTCPSNYFYDRTTMDCVPENSITCISSNACAVTSKNKVVVVDPYSCSGYYYCNNGVGTHGQCPSGWNFSPGTLDCILDFPCTNLMDPDSYCNIVPDGVFIKNTANCNGYQMCWNGEIINGTCPGTFYYNPNTGYCDYPQNVDCVDVVTNPPNAPDPADVCLKNGDFVSDYDTCNGYYLCHVNSSGIMELVHGTCPSGRFFNPNNGGACVPRSQITCSYDRCAGLGNSGIQLSNLSNDGCQGYGLCQDGKLIGTGKCPTGEYFNEVTQLCTTQVVNYPACSTGADSLETTASEPDEEQTTQMGLTNMD